MAYADPQDPRNRAAKREYYHRNKEAHRIRNQQYRDSMKQHIAEVKDVPCMDCGNRHPSYVMDFDHRDPSQKVAAVGRMIEKGSWKLLLEEIEKCDVVCANCHRIRTHGSSTT